VDDLTVVDDLTDSKRLEANGFVVVPDVMDGDQCEVMADNIRTLGNGGVGFRALLDQTWCVELAHQLRRQSKLCALLPVDAVAAQCTLFDKSPESAASRCCARAAGCGADSLG
jgi:hypothetical protein